MQLNLINNPDESQGVVYKIARVIYAETSASSLMAVESLAAMIANRANMMNVSPETIVCDNDLFESNNPQSPRHKIINPDDAVGRGFQMCLRVVRRMLNGTLADVCHGATMFHHCDCMPQWAAARGYIADIDGLLFYA